jgi:diadenylate cyclase
MAGVIQERELVVRDYIPTPHGRKPRTVEHVLADLDEMSAADLLDLEVIARVCGFGGAADVLDTAVSPRGYRLLARVPRLPPAVIDRLVDHFGGLQKLLAATIDDLQLVDGVGETRARSVREGLSRLAESSILERYV